MTDCFVAQVTRHGQSGALITPGGEAMTYSELACAADAVAGQLASRGVGKGSVVVLEGARTPDTIAAMLGTLTVGAAYVPGDPAWPTARFQQIAEIVKPDLLLMERPLSFPGFSSSSLEELISPGHPMPVPPHDRPDPDSIAYILFTSGSTGQPKGVRVSHRNVLALLEWLWSISTLDDLAYSATGTSLAFDPSVLEIYGVLLRGGLVKTVPTVWDSNQGPGKVTFMASTPAVLRALLDAHRLPEGLRLVFSGGESMSSSLAHDMLASRPSARLWNVYGPTEATVLVTAHQVREPVPTTIPIGEPTTGAEIRLLDGEGRQLPAGQIGEICILGPQLAQGYVASGIDDRSSGFSLSDELLPMYRTGDFGQIGEDGLLYFQGRNDHQLKVRGHRVEAGEIEVVLLAVSGIREARVGVVGEGGARRLVGYLVANDHVDAKALRAAIQVRLPDYMVPSQFVFVDQLPLATTGKVDFRRLTNLAQAEYVNGQRPDRVRTADVTTQEVTQLVHEVSAAVCEVLGLPQAVFAPSDDFLSFLGGTSLQLIMLVGRLERRFGVDIQLDALVRDTTIAGLVRAATGEGLTDRRDQAGSKPIAHLIHAYFGGMLRYRRLTEHLAGELNVNLVDAQLLGRGVPARNDVSVLSTQATQQILDFQPSGPFCLVGHSAGGLVALEVGRALRHAGHQVSYLGLIDSPMIGSRWQYWWAQGVQNVPEIVQGVVATPARIAARVASARRHHGSSPEAERFLREISAINVGTNTAVKSFRPAPYPAPLEVFWTKEGKRMAAWRKNLGWGNTLRQARYRSIGGGHVTALDEPYVSDLADLLRSSILEAWVAVDLRHEGAAQHGAVR